MTPPKKRGCKECGHSRRDHGNGSKIEGLVCYAGAKGTSPELGGAFCPCPRYTAWPRKQK